MRATEPVGSARGGGCRWLRRLSSMWIVVVGSGEDSCLMWIGDWCEGVVVGVAARRHRESRRRHPVCEREKEEGGDGGEATEATSGVRERGREEGVMVAVSGRSAGLGKAIRAVAWEQFGPLIQFSRDDLNH
uniref:Uncharacterized protein n=1 Tax=Oryza punctata TaxID=4537 RepID=A0A0E0K008_ORYPU